MSLKNEEEIENLKKIADNLHDKMLANIRAYEKGRASLETLKAYLNSCSKINMERIDACLSRIKHLNKK